MRIIRIREEMIIKNNIFSFLIIQPESDEPAPASYSAQSVSPLLPSYSSIICATLIYYPISYLIWWASSLPSPTLPIWRGTFSNPGEDEVDVSAVLGGYLVEC